MKNKYLTYWSDIPLLYAFAFILDPRAKIRGFTNVLQLLSQLNGCDYSSYLTKVRADLSDIYSKYETKFGDLRLQRANQPGRGIGKKKTAWGKIFGYDIGAGSGGGLGAGASLGAGPGSGLGAGLSVSTGLSSSPSFLSRRTSASALLQAASSAASVVASELCAYLDSESIAQYDDDFNILSWWHEHKLTYHILSILAKDILTVPVSTISSESAFSLTGRIIEERRRRLTPDMVEMLALVKDWEQADSRAQHNIEDPELEDCFENLYLDDV